MFIIHLIIMEVSYFLIFSYLKQQTFTGLILFQDARTKVIHTKDQ